MGVGQCGSNYVVTGMPEPGFCFPRPPLDLWAGEFLETPRTFSGEPRFDASVIERAVGVPGGVGDPSHGTSHYGPPGQESLQAKRISKIHLQGGSRARETWKRPSETLLVSRPASASPMKHSLQLRGQRQKGHQSEVTTGGRGRASLWRGLPAAPPSPRLSRWHHRNQRSYEDVHRGYQENQEKFMCSNAPHGLTAQGDRQHRAHSKSAMGHPRRPGMESVTL